MGNRPPQKKVGKTISNIPRHCSASIFLLTMHIIQAFWPARRTMPTTSIHPPLYSTYSSSLVPYAKLSFLHLPFNFNTCGTIRYVYIPAIRFPTPELLIFRFFSYTVLCKEVTTAYEK
jgi:hypothetical protein